MNWHFNKLKCGTGNLAPINLSLAKKRLFLCSVGFGVLMAMVAVRITGLALHPHTALTHNALNHTALHNPPQMATARADIVDSNGVLLATTLEAVSLYADPARILDPKQAAQRLAPLILDEPLRLEAKLASNRRFVWLKRHLSPRLQKQVNDLGIPGVFFKKEQKRIYPHKNVASHVVGFTDIDSRGLSGVERFFEGRLAGNQAGKQQVKLSLDIRFQHILHSELNQVMANWQADGAAGVILDAQNGEVKAMVSLPDFDPNHPNRAPADALFNRASLGLYEMGSPFKLFTAALVLEHQHATLESRYDARKPLRLGKFRIHDYKPKNSWLSLPEVLQHSSNIGAAQMALAAGSSEQAEFLADFGMSAPLSIELDERATPTLPAHWNEVEVATIGYGHGLAVTPLHLSSAVAALVNGGVFYQPSLVQSDQIKVGTRSLSEETSKTITELMRLVVEQGSGRSAAVEGVSVGGKTGTAVKIDYQGGYDKNSVLVSFVSAFPLESPRYVVMVMVDEPVKKALPVTGGRVAAPAVGNIIRRLVAVAGG